MKLHVDLDRQEILRFDGPIFLLHIVAEGASLEACLTNARVWATEPCTTWLEYFELDHFKGRTRERLERRLTEAWIEQAEPSDQI